MSITLVLSKKSMDADGKDASSGILPLYRTVGVIK
jgi:hypothetical protein